MKFDFWAADDSSSFKYKYGYRFKLTDRTMFINNVFNLQTCGLIFQLHFSYTQLAMRYWTTSPIQSYTVRNFNTQNWSFLMNIAKKSFGKVMNWPGLPHVIEDIHALDLPVKLGKTSIFSICALITALSCSLEITV